MARVRSGLACLALGLAAFMPVTLTPSAARAAEPAASANEAERLANEAYQEHAAGHFGEAIASYLKAYEISKASVVLFNVATIYDRKLHERALAEEYYRRYLAARDAEPELVKKATDRLTVLKEEDAQASKSAPPLVSPLPPAPAPSAATPPPSAASPASGTLSGPVEPSAAASSSGRPLRTAGLVVGAVGIVGLGASAVFGLVAKGKNDDANAVCDGRACSTQQGITAAHDAGTFATVSTICFVTGLLLAGGGATMYLVAPRDAPPSAASRVTVGPLLGATSAGMTVGGSF